MSDFPVFRKALGDELQSTWDEHFKLDNRDSLAAIKSLSSRECRAERLAYTNDPLAPLFDDTDLARTSPEDSFIIQDYNYGESPSISTTTVTAKSTGILTVSPVPQYEAVTPSQSCIMKGDDPDQLLFLPYPESSELDIIGFMDLHSGLAWQDDHTDIEG